MDPAAAKQCLEALEADYRAVKAEYIKLSDQYANFTPMTKLGLQKDRNEAEVRVILRAALDADLKSNRLAKCEDIQTTFLANLKIAGNLVQATNLRVKKHRGDHFVALCEMADEHIQAAKADMESTRDFFRVLKEDDGPERKWRAKHPHLEADRIRKAERDWDKIFHRIDRGENIRSAIGSVLDG